MLQESFNFKQYKKIITWPLALKLPSDFSFHDEKARLVLCMHVTAWPKNLFKFLMSMYKRKQNSTWQTASPIPKTFYIYVSRKRPPWIRTNVLIKGLDTIIFVILSPHLVLLVEFYIVSMLFRQRQKLPSNYNSTTKKRPDYVTA